jgi:hypothetical protein
MIYKYVYCSCGVVALAMASQILEKETTARHILEISKNNGLSVQGELFSGNFVLHSGLFLFEIRLVYLSPFHTPHFNEINVQCSMGHCLQYS